MIKIFLKIASWGLIVALAVMLPVIASRLPSSSSEKIKSVSDGWAGVLRVWICPGFEPGNGSFTPWLNERLSRFEARHSGVYVQVITVSAETMKSFASGETNPPDAILFSPGMITRAEALAPLAAPALRADLTGAGEYGGVFYAAPVAMGGYAWVYNAAYLSGIPADFRALPAIETKAKNKEAIFYVNCPADSPYMSWSSALLSLMADRYVVLSETPSATTRAGEGIDLGLPYRSAAPELNPLERTETVSCHLPEELPENFRRDATVYGDFVNGRAAAIPATQREIRRLQILSDSGRAPDYRVEAAGENFTDQLLMYAIVDYPRSDIDKRQELCGKLLDFLLTEDSQRALERVRAFPVIDTAPIYAGQAGMAQLETAMSDIVATPNAFDDMFRDRAREEADRFAGAPAPDT